MRVLKFGGTSVATAPRRHVVASIVEAATQSGPVTVVTSALGGVTDHLVAAIDAAISSEETSQREARIAVIEALHLDDVPNLSPGIRQEIVERLQELSRHLEGIALLGDCPATTRHRVLSLGERMALPLVVFALCQRGLEAIGVDGSVLLRTEDAHAAIGEETDVDMVTSRDMTRAWAANLAEGCVPVVTGFVAADSQQRTTTLGRGASDLTATLLGTFLDAASVEIWTDVDGVLSAPPRWVEHPRRLPRLSYSEAAEMARFGARVLHPRTLEPLQPTSIPVCIRNTLRPQELGTCIGPSSSSSVEHRSGDATVRAITARRGTVLLRLSGGGLTLYRELYGALEGMEIEPLMLVHGSGGSSVTLVVSEGQAESSLRCLQRRFRKARLPLQVERRDAVGVVAAIGDGADPALLTAQILQTLRDDGIESLALSLPCLSGRSTENAVAVLVDDDQVPRAVRRLHRDLVERQVKGPSEDELSEHFLAPGPDQAGTADPAVVTNGEWQGPAFPLGRIGIG